jgi:antitoxin component YwqK of YwqJK toxin-antitoxin module
MELSMDDLEWDIDTYQAVIDGDPITGNVYSRDENGKLLAVSEYRDGYLNGWRREYYPDGKLAEEGEFRANKAIGLHRKWYEDGQLKEEFACTETGTLVRHRKWRADGTVRYDSNPGADG